MFKAHDIRTKVENLTDVIKEKLYQAIAIYLKESLKCESVVICRDARLAAPELAQGLCSTLLDCGLDVLLNPLPISTCQFYYSCLRNKESAGLMITASHNPGNYIGIKIVGPNLFPIAYGIGQDGGIKRIKELYDSNASLISGAHGSCRIINYQDEYINYCMKLASVEIGSLSGMKFLMEFLSGSAGTEIALAFQKAGATITCRNMIPDGYFKQGDPNPIIEESIAPARKAMKEGDFDLGFCFDGDGDRIDLMFKDGSQIIPGLNMSILAPYLLELYKGTKTSIFADTKALPIALYQLSKAGCNVSIIKNGHSSIKAKLKEYPNYMGAVEESSHYYINLPFDIDDFSKGFAPTESTLVFALLSARCLKERPDAYEEIKKIQSSIYREREWSLHCDSVPEKMIEIEKEVSDRMKMLGALVIDKMEDGSSLEATLFRFNLPKIITDATDLKSKTWTQVSQRISASEDSVIRWEISSSNEDECRKLKQEIKKIVEKAYK